MAETVADGEVVHIAGLDVEVGPYLRQRCAWCGEILIDVDLRRVAFVEGPMKLATWTVGGLVAVEGNMSALREHIDGDQLPMNSCVPLEALVDG